MSARSVMGGLVLLLSLPVAQAEEQTLGFERVVEKILGHYPSLEVARLQVQRSREEIARVESQLGWEMASDGGVSHDVSVFGTPTDRADVNLSLERQLESGHRVGVSGNYTYEDSAFTVNPEFPNPSHSTQLDLNYRIPLKQGEDNPAYTESLAGAAAGVEAERAAAQALRNDIANQALDLFYAKALSEARLNSAREALNNARRLQEYIADRRELGLAEEKDSLQAEAQVRAQQTALEQLEMGLEQQQIALNRLMGEPWQRRYRSVVQVQSQLIEQRVEALVDQAEARYPPLQQNRARLEVTETVLHRSRDQRKDQLDLIFSVGSRTRSGDATTGSVNEQDMAGQIRFEYRESLNKQGLDAEVRQAQLDRTIAIQEIRRARDELTYGVASLVQEINAARRALDSSRRRLQSEQDKYREAMQRYRQGREQTDRLIQFDNELNDARLTVAELEVELARRLSALRILHGSFWATLDTGELR
ncbi:TolC family protein [Thiohalophilus thiocyanatoxydans]|uniref:Outer membrane efflux protein n=1 Tax=Thiohalophilus thiocyanatoxydans TaxID=381308 RepID=A0A4R8IHK8_9GAMM|nr:TolC family protein [Thiohalophilus thiocyanatoxydans]TDY00091.1 outer membrane efflux protein [Thiohalophilus thiocyanatoxydans]